MINYLSNVELNAILSSTAPDENKTLYFQDSASHPAFLYLSSDDRLAMPSSESITAIFTTMQKVLKLVLPGATFSASPFIPINNRLGTSDIAKYIQGFNETTISIVFGNVSYSLFDDASSDFFVIARSELTLAELNDTYGGSFRLAPVNVLKVLKQIGMLMDRITTSNTSPINPIEERGDVTPPPPPSGNTFIENGDVWEVVRGGPFGGTDITSIRLNVPNPSSVSDYNQSAYRGVLQDAMALAFPGKTHQLSNCRIVDIPGISYYVQWDCVES